MLLTVFCLRRDRSELTFSLQVDADFELQNFRALCALESGIPASESQIIFAEQLLADNHRSLASYGLKDGDVVILQQMENGQAQPSPPFPGLPRIDFSSITVPGTSTQLSQSLQLPFPTPASAPSRPLPPPELPSSPQGLDNPALLRAMLLANPHELSLLKERNPPLAEALLSGDLERFTQVLVEQQQDRARREQERIRLFSADPFDLEAQAKIEEDIRQQNIEENMTIAMEEAPESFGQVVMLYINCKVNGHPVKAFVDSGAQMTIMSQACAERCNIMRLVDRRWAGIARGVGTQRIIGRVHLAQVQIEGDFLPCSFSILEEQPMDMLLGLDMLKRHQCSIDLKNNVLVIGTTGSQTAFLPEGELPECAKLAYGPGREDVRPDELADQELAEALQKSAEEAENTETTSLEAPSQPTSGGFKHPVCFPEFGLNTNANPASRSLDRSISAPLVCSPTSGQAEPANPRAVKSLDSLLEPSRLLGSKQLLASPLNLAGAGAASADNTGPNSLLRGSSAPQNIPAKMVASGCPLKKGAPGLEPREAEGENRPHDGSQETNEPDASLLLEPMELPPDFKRCRTPRKEPSLGEQDVSLPPAAAADKGGVEERPKGALAQLLGSSCSPEGPPAPEASDPHLGMSTKDSGTEMGLLKPHSFPLSLGLPPVSGLAQLGNAATSQSRDQDEDPGISLTSALKELHQLLIVSAKHNLRRGATQQEEHCSLVVPPEEPAASEVSRERHQDMVLSHQTVSLEVGTEMLEEPYLAEGHQEEPLVIQGVSGGSCSIPASSLVAWQPPQGDKYLEIMAQHLSSEQPPSCAVSGQSSLPSHGLGPDPQLPQSNPSSSPEDRGVSGASETASANKPPEDQPELLSLSSSASFPRAPDHHSPLASAANLDQIVGAGFTPQEAGEALEHAGGNADLALLILLARNIVVPT